MLGTLPITRPETLKDLAYKQVKGLLCSGNQPLDSVYSANQLADSLGVSRTPVREALMQLTAEGFLVSLGGRGFKIRQFSLKEIKDLFDTRRLIEGYAAKRLALNPERNLESLTEIFQRMKECAKKQNTEGFLEADESFHLGLIRQNDNQFLLGVMENLHDCISLVGHNVIGVKDRMAEVLTEHQSILEALKQGDPVKASESMDRHLGTTEKYLLSALDESVERPKLK